MLEPGRNLEAVEDIDWHQVVRISGPRMGVVAGTRVPRDADWA